MPILVCQDRFGMVEKVIQTPGPGRKPLRGQKVKIHCTGYLQAGMRKFWSTRDKYEKAFTFRAGVGDVIKGWDEVVLTMRKGESSRVTITGGFGYGVKGNEQWNIPSMAGLIMDMELLDIGEEIILPSAQELAKRAIAERPVFIDRSQDRRGDSSMRYNAAPF